MGTFFRSEEMALCQLFIQPEAGYPSVAELGEIGTVQFRDLNADATSFQRSFVNEVRRCDEMEQKLRYIETAIKQEGIKIPDIYDCSPRAPNPREVMELETQIKKTERSVFELSNNEINLKKNFLELTELRHVLEKSQLFFQNQVEAREYLEQALNNDGIFSGPAGGGLLEFVSGVISRDRLPAFERMLWRISRGNIFLRLADLDEALEDPKTGNQMFKTVFVAFYRGEQLKIRLEKICSGFHASLYHCENSNEMRSSTLEGVGTRLQDLNLILGTTRDHRHQVLLTASTELLNWKIMVRKVKAIYHTMNLFNMDLSNKCFIGECWVPKSELSVVRECLDQGSRVCGSSIASFINIIGTTETPPTFHRTNKFTRGFQNLIDAYGVASYREVNPAFYTIITFPFLFAIMFGDAGHGLILTLFAGWMVLWEKNLMKKKIKNEIWNIFFDGRYIILLMGFFSMYTGAIYNDVFSKSFNIFGSSWKNYYDNKTLFHESKLQPDPNKSFKNTPYMFGLDPVWALAENKIIFLNSYKMKISIIIGVVHMISGLGVSGINIMYKKKYSSLLLELLPQLLFLICLFAYLSFLMILKWILYSSDSKDVQYSSECAPSVLITFIHMVMFTPPAPKSKCSEFMFGFQPILQITLIAVALLCIPIMLFGKPVYTLWTKKKKPINHQGNDGEKVTDIEVQGESVLADDSDGEHEEETFGELMIHQAIHTIEYVLSSVSHTASYLRLWALSLAHAQLSEVLWSMILKIGMGVQVPADGTTELTVEYLTSLKTVGYMFRLCFTFGAWSLFTLSILIMMEGLSAFLHTLRLHWVEFMSKFYEGEGYLFQPLCFKDIIDTEEVEEE